MLWKIFWVIVGIWVLNHPDQANAPFHSAWHAFFGSAGS